MKKFFLVLMVMVLITTTSFAAFSDMPDTHWAKGVVDEMVKEGIISGYTDGTFRPSKEISKIESLILLSRIAGLNKYPNEATKYLETYTSDLSKYTTQYKKDVAYLLGVGVLKTSDLDNLLASDKINTPLTREEMAVLVTKVLGKESEATKNSIVVLPFKDTSTISSNARPYVYYVYSQKIMVGMNDESGNEIFSPKTSLTRAQAASTLQRIYKKVTVKPSTTPSTPSATSFVTGTITKIDTSASSVWIKSTTGEEEYEYDSNTKFYVSGKDVTSSSMKVNATVTATLTDDAYITSMNISEGAKVTTSTVKGTIYAADGNKKTISITTNGQRVVYNYDSNTTYTLNGKSSTLLNAIKKDYEVTLTVDSTKYIKKAAVTSPEEDEERIIGKLVKYKERDGYIVIEDVEDSDDEYLLIDYELDVYETDDYSYEDDVKDEYYYDDDTDFEIDGKEKTYDNLYDYLDDADDNDDDVYIAITLDDEDIILMELADKKSDLEETEDEEDEDKDEKDYISPKLMLENYFLVGAISDIYKDGNDYYIELKTDDGKYYDILISDKAGAILYDSNDPEEDIADFFYDYDDIAEAYEDDYIEDDDRVIVILSDNDDGDYETGLIILLD